MTTSDPRPKRWFWVTGTVTVSAQTAVLAESEEEAMRLADGVEGEIRHGLGMLDAADFDGVALIDDADGCLDPSHARLLTADEISRHGFDEDEREDDDDDE